MQLLQNEEMMTVAIVLSVRGARQCVDARRPSTGCTEGVKRPVRSPD